MSNTSHLYKGVKAISAAIAALKAKGSEFQADAHKAACSVLLHVGKNSDARVVERFVSEMVDAMPEAARVNALREWFVAFGPVTFDDENKVLFVRSKPTKLGDAMDKPFWKFKKTEGVAYQPLDIAELLDKTIKRIEADAKKLDVDHSAVIGALKAQRNAVLIAQTAH